MKLDLRIVGKTLDDVKRALNLFMDELNEGKAHPSCYCPLNDQNDTRMDYSFSNGRDVFVDDAGERTVDPYGRP